MKKRDLDFFVVGAQKCATSWMFYCLQDHPSIVLPSRKVEIGYIGGEMFHEKGECWFYDRFSEPDVGQKVGDVSVDYLYDTASAGVLKDYSIQPKIIVSLRDPLERMISSYYWLLRRGKLPNLPLNEGLKPLIAEEPGFPRRIDSALEEVVRRSCYAEQIETYLQQYPADDLLIVLYDEIKSEPLKSIQKVYHHIGVEDDFNPPSLSAQPKKNTYNKALLAFERIANLKIIAKISNYAHQGLGKLSRKEKKPELSDELKCELQARFAPQIRATREVMMRLPSANRPADEVIDNLWRMKAER